MPFSRCQKVFDVARVCIWRFSSKYPTDIFI